MTTKEQENGPTAKYFRLNFILSVFILLFLFLLLYFFLFFRRGKKFFFVLLLFTSNDMSRGICLRKGYFCFDLYLLRVSFESSSSKERMKKRNKKRFLKVLSCCRFKSYQKNIDNSSWIQSKSQQQNIKKNTHNKSVAKESGIRIL